MDAKVCLYLCVNESDSVYSNYKEKYTECFFICLFVCLAQANEMILNRDK